jgi:hypothetical protein
MRRILYTIILLLCGTTLLQAVGRERVLGIVTVATAGTPVRLTVNETTPSARLYCKGINIQRNDTTQTGVIFLQDGNVAAGALGVGGKTIGMLVGTTTLPLLSYPAPYQSEALNAADYYLDASVSGESANVVCTCLTSTCDN